MAKKRKLNSKNPKYASKTVDKGPKIKEKRLMCDVQVRNSEGKAIEGKTIPIYGVWYEEDEAKEIKEEKWWKKPNLN